MNTLWTIKKVYTETGISYDISIPNSNHSIKKEIPWQDEMKAEFNLIKELTERIIGPINKDKIQISHYNTGNGTGYYTMKLLPMNVEIPCNRIPQRENWLALFQKAIQQKLQESECILK